MRKAKGYSLIEIIISLAVGAIVVAMVTGIFGDVYKAKKRADFLIALSTIRLNFQRAILRTVDWNQTKSNNSLMTCFRRRTSFIMFGSCRRAETAQAR